MFNLNLSQSYSSIENNGFSFGLNSSSENYESQLLNELLSIENNNSLTDNRNSDIDNALHKVFINNSDENSNSTHHNLLGRKKKGSESTGKHNEYSEDNMIRKFKRYSIETFLNKINSELKAAPVFIEFNGKKYKANKLVKINHKFAKNITVNEIRNFLNNKIKTTLSVAISD